VPAWQSYSYAFGPVVSLAAICVIIALSRWVFSGGQSVVPRVRRPPTGPPDYGLLVRVVRVPTRADAELLREVLDRGGVRASVTAARDPRSGQLAPGLDVLVFAADADRARALVAAR
jgi:hypothetical protein